MAAIGDDALAGDEVVVLADEQEVLAGTLANPAQALVSQNRALLALAAMRSPARVSALPSEAPEPGTDWLVWEADKQRRLRLLTGGGDVA